MDSQKRLLLALALSFAVTTVYVFFFAPPPPTPGAGAPDAGAVAVVAPVPAPSRPVSVPSGAAPALTDSEPAREIVIARPDARFSVTTVGGGLSSVLLEGVKTREQEQVSLSEGWSRLLGKKASRPPPMNLAVTPFGAPPPLAVGIDGAQPLSPHAHYAVEDQSARRVVLKAVQGGWEIRKTLEWPEKGYELLYTLSVKNTGTEPRVGDLKIFFTRGVDPKGEEAPSFFGGVGNQASALCRVGTDIKRRAPSNKPPDDFSGPVVLWGVDHQYFVSAVFALTTPPDGRCVLEASPTERMATANLPLTLGPGETQTQHFGVYLGPKRVDELRKVPSGELAALARAAGVGVPLNPELDRTVDFGIWAVIAKILLWFLNFFHGWVSNWGVAIILLTVFVKLALFPLTQRSMVGMEAMKKLQPKIEALKKKYPDDNERQQLEMMKLYREAKVNPFNSCLLMLVQMPVWIALYTTLRTSYELYGEPFSMWTDLTYKDPTYILPILLGITMVVTSKLQPPAADPVQARMFTYVMPVFFSFLLLNTPAGLTLYMVTNNLLSIVQTYALRRWMATHPSAASPPGAERAK